MEKIEPINEKEQAFITTQLTNAAKFVEGFSHSDSANPLRLAALDRAFAAWVASKPVDANLVNTIINYVGVAFGQALVEGIGFEWVIATDEHKSDLAVYCMPGQGDILVYPANFVAKRWERRETNFLEEAYSKIASDVHDIFRERQRAPSN